MRQSEVIEGTRCWKGYKRKGFKTMFGKRVPNCVKNEDVQVVSSNFDVSDDILNTLTAQRKEDYA